MTTGQPAFINAITEQSRMYSNILDKEAAITELKTALQEAKAMLKDLGMHEDSVGLAGINNIIKKYANE
jgi:hypothetical protein